MEFDDERLIELLKLPEFVRVEVDDMLGKLEIDEDKLFEIVAERVAYRDRLGLGVLDKVTHPVNDPVEVALDEAILDLLGDKETPTDEEGEFESGTFTDIPRNDEGTQ